MTLNRIPSHMVENVETGTKVSDEIGILRRVATFLDDYEHLIPNKNVAATPSDWDWSDSLQTALNVLTNDKSVLILSAGKTYKVTKASRLKGNKGNYIFGNGATLAWTGLISTSDEPILYYTSLSAKGASDKTMEYNAGVYIYDLNFDGGGYGVGYKHVVAGQLHMSNCVFKSGLESGVVLAGTNGVDFYKCKFEFNSKKGLFCARQSEDSYSVGYTIEGAGWNDGIHLEKCIIQTTTNSHGVYYSGSTSEGVLTLRDCMVLGASNATGVYARTFTNLVVDGGWAEFFTGGVVFQADGDTNGFEPHSFVVRNFQFTGYGTEVPNYYIWSKAVRTLVEDCVFQGSPNNEAIWFSSGTTSNFDFSLTKTATDKDTTNGRVSFPSSGLEDGNDIIMTDGTVNYYCKLYYNNYPSGSYQYNTYTFVEVTDKNVWKGSVVTDYTLTRILNPTITIGANYTVKSILPTKDICEVKRPIFIGISKSKTVGWGNFGAIRVVEPFSR